MVCGSWVSFENCILFILRDVRGFLSGQKEQVLGVIGLQMPWDWCFCFRELGSFYITVVLCGNLGIQGEFSSQMIWLSLSLSLAHECWVSFQNWILVCC